MADRVRISVSGEIPELKLVDAVAGSFCESRGLTGADATAIRETTAAVCEWLIGRVYPEGVTGEVVVQFELGEGEARVSIEDWGEPIASFGSGGVEVPGGLADIARAATDLRLVNLGRDGKRLTFSIPANGATPTAMTHLAAFAREAPSENHPVEAVDVRDATADDAESISQLLFSNYGLGYGHPEFYDPAWLAERIEDGTIASTVATCDGEVIGHHALMTSPNETAAETGVAVVHPAYRGLGVFGTTSDHSLQRASDLGLDAVYGRGVTSHVFSQKAELAHGYVPTALMLGAVPSAGRDDAVLRGSTLVSYLPLSREPRSASFPSRYEGILRSAYEQLDLATAPSDPDAAAAGIEHLPPVSIVCDDARASSTITVRRLSDGGREQLLEAFRHVVHRHDDVAWCDLDLTAMTGDVLDEAVHLLREYDFFLCGLMPFGEAGHDRLRLQALLTDDVDLDGIQLASTFALDIRDQVLGDLGRVRSD